MIDVADIAWGAGTRGSKSPSMESLGLDETYGWRMAATIYLATGLTLVSSAFLNLLPMLDDRPRFLLLAATATACSPAWIICKRVRLGEAWLGVPILLGYGIIWALLATTRTSGYSAIALLFLLPAVASVYALRPWQAAPYVVIGFASIVVAALLDTSGTNRVTQLVSLAFVTAATVVIIGAMQARQRALVRRYQLLASRDPLTGLANLRAFRTALASEFSADNRARAQLVLFMIDLDNFKLVNDRHSHAVGDLVLKAAANAITEAAEPGDFVCRKGGDEFAVLARIDEGRDPEEKAHSLSNAISRARAMSCPDVEPRASVGFVVAGTGDDPDSIVVRANDALHRAKDIAHPERRKCAGSEFQPAINLHQRSVRCGDPASHSGALPVSGGMLAIASRDRAKAPDVVVQKIGWEIAAAAFAAVPAISVFMGLTGINPEMRSPMILATALVSFLLSPVFFRMAKTSSPEAMVHWCLVLSMTLLAVFMVNAPNSRLALVDFFLLPGLLASFYMRPRVACFYVIGAMAMYGAFAINQDYGYPFAKLVVAVLIVIVLGLLFEMARRQIREYQTKIAELSVTDALTGLANLRALESSLRGLVDEAKTTDQDLFVIAIDLDEFKPVNDRYNHTVGDAVLHAVAKAMRSAVRERDIVARRGGDEFAIILLRPRGEALISVIERVQAAIERERLAICPDINPRASVGVVSMMDGECIDDLLRRADEALHHSRMASKANRSHNDQGATPATGHRAWASVDARSC